MSKSFDVVVIGAGPGGYIAAIRAAQLGLSVACIDGWRNKQGKPAPGGTCTNVGCIPSKALLQSSENYEQAQLHFAEHGIRFKDLAIDVKRMIARKDAVVQQNNEGILYLFKKNKISFFSGRAAFVAHSDSGYEIKVNGVSDECLLGKHIVIATGSCARALPGVEFDEEKILSNAGALDLQKVPKKLVLIGSGVIGLEMGSVWRRLGSEVTILEAMPGLLPFADEQLAREAHKMMSKQGLEFQFGVQVKEVKKSARGVSISYQDAQGVMQKIDADRVIVSIGRIPHTEGLKPEVVGLALDERGAVVVDADCRTNLPNVWAIGDVVRGPMLAHKAQEEGVAVAERIAGQYGHVNYDTIPCVIYTQPEMAWVGQTEQGLKQQGIAYKAGSFPFMANGRARAMGQTAGFVKILADAQTDEVLGVHMIGPMVSELIGEAVMAMEFRACAQDIACICHAHPSLSEAIKEAALAVDNWTLNF